MLSTVEPVLGVATGEFERGAKVLASAVAFTKGILYSSISWWLYSLAVRGPTPSLSDTLNSQIYWESTKHWYLFVALWFVPLALQVIVAFRGRPTALLLIATTLTLIDVFLLLTLVNGPFWFVLCGLVVAMQACLAYWAWKTVRSKRSA